MAGAAPAWRAALIALALAGAGVGLNAAVFGGGGSSSPQARRPPAPSVAVAAAAADRAEQEARARRRASARRERARRARRRRLERARRRDAARERARAIRRVAPTVLELLRFGGASVRVDRAARVVTVAVASEQACTAGRREELQIRKHVRRPFPAVREVRVTVRGSGRSLLDYVSSSCGSRRGSRGSRAKGVVFSRRGSGFYDTGPLAIASRRWTLELDNADRFLQVLILEGGELRPEMITKFEPGRARETFTGPGTFELRIAASGRWRVRVRERS